MNIKQKVKRLLGKEFRYKCLECGKGHDGLVLELDGGYTNVGDFCSFKCAQKYIFTNGYTLKNSITDKKDKCIICGKEHNNKFINEKQGYSTRFFCGKDCLEKAHKQFLPKIKKKMYKENFKQMLDLFKSHKTVKDLKETQVLENLDIKYFFDDYKTK